MKDYINPIIPIVLLALTLVLLLSITIAPIDVDEATNTSLVDILRKKIKVRLVVETENYTYVEDEDVITYHALASILSTLLNNDSLGSTWQDSAGNYRSIACLDPDPSFAIIVSDYTGVEDDNVYDGPLLGNYVDIIPDTVDVVYNGTHYRVTLAVYSISVSFETRSVGFVTRHYGQVFDSRAFQLLVMYDILDTSIPPNTSMNVTYTITIEASLPFTRNFYNLMIIYWFGGQDIVDITGSLPAELVVYDSNGNPLPNGYEIHTCTYTEFVIDGTSRDYCVNYVEKQFILLDNYGYINISPVDAYNVGDNMGSDYQLASIVSSTVQRVDVSLVEWRGSGTAYPPPIGSHTLYGYGLFLEACTYDVTYYVMMGYVEFSNPINVDSGIDSINVDTIVRLGASGG